MEEETTPTAERLDKKAKFKRDIAMWDICGNLKFQDSFFKMKK